MSPQSVGITGDQPGEHSALVVTDRDELAGLFGLDPAIHVYGLGDLEDRYWDHSTWWRRGSAAVGRVRLPGPEGVVAVYAISPRAPAETTALLVEQSDQLPVGGLVLAPLGADDALGRRRPVNSFGTHVKMSVDARGFVPPTGLDEVVVLGHGDLPDLLSLYDSEPGAAYFLPAMLEHGMFMGIRDDGRLVSAGGTHALSKRFGVAAFGGIITDPQARGRGHGRRLTGALTRAMLAEGLTVGLNVSVGNDAAVRLYGNLGYRVVHRYVEFELVG